MSNAPFNAFVTNSNLAIPVPKLERDCSMSEPYVQLYTPAPESIDDLDAPDILTSPALLEDPFYSVYGFRLPEQIRLRLIANNAPVNRQHGSHIEQATRLLKGLGYGISLFLDAANTEVELITKQASQGTGVSWNVSGQGTSPGYGTFKIEAYGVAGHAVKSYKKPAHASLWLVAPAEKPQVEAPESTGIQRRGRFLTALFSRR